MEMLRASDWDKLSVGRRLSESIIKRIAKHVVDLSCMIAVLVPVVIYKGHALLVGRTSAFPGWSQLLSLLPGNVGVYVRRAFYRLVLPACGSDVCISFGTLFSHPTIAIGDRVYVGAGCMIGDVTLEDDVLVGSHASIINGRRQHCIERLDIPVREQPGEYPRVVIGSDSWIGDRAVVTADVGSHAVVGAGAVTTKPVPDYAVVAGNPAQIIRSRMACSTTRLSPPENAAVVSRGVESASPKLELPRRGAVT